MKVNNELNNDQKSTDKRNINSLNNSENKKLIPKKKKTWKQYLLFISIGILLLVAIIIMIIFVIKAHHKKDEAIQKSEVGNNLGPMEQEPGLDFSTKINDLKRYIIKENNTQDITIDGHKSKININREIIYDLFIISEEEASEENKIFYNKTYLEAVAIASECTSTENKICEPKRFVDLNHQIDTNLRNLDEINDLKDIPISLCLINITDNNIILSMKCPESLSEFKKNSILSDIHFFKPTSIKRANKEKRNITITQKTDGNKYLIREKIGGSCPFGNQLNSLCTNDMNITKDSGGNIISLNEENITTISKNNNNSFLRNKMTNLLDITNETEYLSSEKYLSILNKILPKLNKYMKLKEYISIDDLHEIYKENKGQSNTNITKRNLEENPKKENFDYVAQLFTLNDYIWQYELNLRNSYNNFMEANLDLNINGKKNKLVSLNENFSPDSLLRKIILLNKVSINLANKLYYKIHENLEVINEIIFNNITSLKKLIVYKDLGETNDLSLSNNYTDILPSNIINESNSLKNELEIIFSGIRKGNLKNKIDLMNNNIYFYINKTQLAINGIYNNLIELARLLNSPKNKLTEIVTFYINNSDSFYNDIIEKAKNIFDSYYQKEYDIIISQIDLNLNDFKKNISYVLKNNTKLINNLKTNIENNSIIIEGATENDYNKIISNFKDSNNLINEIIGKIKYKLKNGIIYEDSGYFISKNKIEDNSNLYNKTINDLYLIIQKLDNDEYIDKAMNEVMIKFKNNINSAINYIYQVIDEEFIIKKTNLDDSFIIEKNKISNDIAYLGIEISNKIKKENNYYLTHVNKNIDLFIKENMDYLNQLMMELNLMLSEESLEKLSESYDKAFESSLNCIKKDIQKNKLLINDYFNNLTEIMQNNSKIFELLQSLDETNLLSLEGFENILAFKKITKGYLSKNNIFKKNVENSKNYIDEELFTDLLFVYKNIIVKIKGLLQSIKNNKITEEFPELIELSFIEKNKKIKDDLNKRLNKIISDNIFNNKYLERLNNFKNSQISENEIINNYIGNKQNILNNYNISNDMNNDFCINFYEKKTYSGLSSDLYTDTISKDYCYQLPNAFDNHIKLVQPSIYLDDNISNFISNFNNFYLLLRNKTDAYNNKINEFKNKLTLLEKQTLEQNITFDYLLQIQEYILSLIEKNSEKIINYSYNYYQNITKIKTKSIFDDLSLKSEIVFDLFKEDIINNKKLNNFKNSMNTFYLIASIYENSITNNITRDIYDSIIHNQQSELNYAISSFFNNLIKFVNSTQQYIISNIPYNQIGFNNILNQRKNEINNFFSELIQKIIDSKNEALNIKNQILILKVEEKDFFKMNSILNTNIEETRRVLEDKINNISELSENKNIDELSFVSNLYLEDSENGNHIKNFIELINDEQFIHLNYTNFIKLINENLLFNQNDFINSLKSELINSNIEISHEFSNIKENYIMVLEKMITQYFTKESIIKKINDFYGNKFKELSQEEIKQIKNYINEIVFKIKENLSNEANRLKTTANSYNNDLTKINNTIFEYKQNLFNKLNKILFIEFDDFHKDMINKVYNNYIEKYLNEYIKEAKKVTLNYKTYQTLNSSYNIGEIIDNSIEELVKEYKYLIKMHIDYKYEEYKQKLLEAINLTKIINEIDEEYNSNLLKILKKVAIYSQDDSEYPSYDLNNDIKNNINNDLNTKLNDIKNIILTDIEDQYQINIDEWEILNFNMISKNLSEINSSFTEFISCQILNEKNNVNTFLKDYIKSNFNTLLNNILSVSGKEFFKRIILYNDNLKIKNLYDKIKNSLSQSLNYYIALYDSSNIKALPKDLKFRLFQLNNIDQLIKDKNNQIIKILHSKTENFIEKIKTFIIKKYILFFKEDASIEFNFNEIINIIIDENLNEIIPDLKNNSQNLLSTFLNENFEKSYKEVLDNRTNMIIETIDKQKEMLKLKLNNLFTLDSDKTLEEINQKINNTLKAINEYNNINFKPPDELLNYLNNYGDNIINPCFNGIKNIVVEEKINKINFIDEKYYNFLYSNEFKNLSDNIYYSIKEKYTNNIMQSINSYGISDYEQILENEMDRYSNLRSLSDYEEQGRNDIIGIFNNLFFELEQEKIMINEYLDGFDDIILANINNINLSYKKSKNILINSKNIDYLIPVLDEKLIIIKNLALDYYNYINNSFYKIQNYLNDSIYELDDLLNQCNNITNSTLLNKYTMISKEFKSFNIEYNETIEELEDNQHSYTQNAEYEIYNRILGLNKKGKFNLLLKNETINFNNLTLTASIINQIVPKKMSISIINRYGTCGKFVNEYMVEFNNVNYTTFLQYNTNSLWLTFNSLIDFESYCYSITKYKYEEDEEVICYTIGGMKLCVNGECIPKETIIESKKKFIVERKIINNTYLYDY